MTRPIILTEEQKQEILLEILENLNKNKNMFDGKVSFSKTYKWVENEGDVANVVFTPLAYAKMVKLIEVYETEVAWHGVAKRDEEDDSVFWIEDILVYPQTVSGATVNTDQEKYTNWVNHLEDDQFNNLKMQGHSHVRMGTSPSATDTSHQKDIIEQLRGNMFYIFMIWNKRMENTTWVYDMKRNTVYDGKDVKISVAERGGDKLDDFITDAKKLVSDRVYSYNSSTPASGTKTTTSAPTNSGAKTSNVTPAKTTSSYEIIPAHSASAIANKKEGNKAKNPNEGKRRERANPKKVIGAGWSGANKNFDKEWDEWEAYLAQGYHGM